MTTPVTPQGLLEYLRQFTQDLRDRSKWTRNQIILCPTGTSDLSFWDGRIAALEDVLTALDKVPSLMDVPS